MIKVRKANDRGHANHGWLEAYYTFSFNRYLDRDQMGFRTLRVINEDRIQPGQGFGTHPHNDMEIITYVLEGALEHKDSMGNGSVIRPGDIQKMSAGTGITHSEFNPSNDDPTHLLQIWLLPSENGIKPEYEQTTFSRDDKLNKLCLIASPDGRNRSVTMHQDVSLYATVLEPTMSIDLSIEDGRHAWIQIVSGSVKLGDQSLTAGDGVAVSDENKLNLVGVEETEFLIFDLA